ncbi:hypothetical protein ZIOFF_069726 [Zingiber officinale]|uniref:Piwi domain-containing protein n=1 Tax=Zingiber officinale TaxID=94328 RepID=A0A8J5EU95_ZINOF|nr:hypothetical protein ZIOFF_069726 [Zingiber officinale]
MTGEAAVAETSSKVGITFSNCLWHVESMSLHPSGAGRISHINTIILDEPLESEENDLIFPSQEFSSQALVYDSEAHMNPFLIHYYLPSIFFSNLDGTLYPLSSRIAAECHKNILGVEESNLLELCVVLYKNYGTTMDGLKLIVIFMFDKGALVVMRSFLLVFQDIGYNFDYDDFHSFVHGILPYETLKPDLIISQLLLSLPVRKVVNDLSSSYSSYLVLNFVEMVNGGRVNSWTCINFAKNVQDNFARGFCHDLAQMCQISGMEKELDLLIVKLPDNDGYLYGDQKQICETGLALVSQCCLTKHVFKMSKQYLPMLASRSMERGVVLVDVLSRRIPLVSDRPTIIFGADVTHPHPGEDSSPSIAVVSCCVSRLARGTLTGGMIKTSAMQYPGSYLFPSKRLLDKSLNGLYSTSLCLSRTKLSISSDFLWWSKNIITLDCLLTITVTTNLLIRLETYCLLSILEIPGNVVNSKICHPTKFNLYLCNHASIQVTHLTTNTFCMMYLFR